MVTRCSHGAGCSAQDRRHGRHTAQARRSRPRSPPSHGLMLVVDAISVSDFCGPLVVASHAQYHRDVVERLAIDTEAIRSPTKNPETVPLIEGFHPGVVGEHAGIDQSVRALSWRLGACVG